MHTDQTECRLFRLLRLLLGSASALLGLLAIFPAPTALLWMAAIGATEWGHLLAPLGLLPLLPGWRRTWSGRVGGVLGGVATLLLLTPLLRAMLLAQQIPAQLNSAFGETRLATGTSRPAPLVLNELLTGVTLPSISPRTLVYSAPNGQELRLDLYQPPGSAGPAPCVIVIHGGSWQSGDRSEFPQLSRYLAARGYVVAALDYRLAPIARFPTAYDDVRVAIDFLKRNATDLGIDGNRLALLGRSAGAQLALLTAYRINDPAIRGVIAFYGPADLRYGYANPANPWVIDSRGTLEAYLGGAPDTVPQAYDSGSPIAFVGPATPPTLLLHGQRDELVSPAQSARLAERLSAAGRPHLLLTFPWATHGFDFNFSGPGGQISTYTIEYFLAIVLSG